MDENKTNETEVGMLSVSEFGKKVMAILDEIIRAFRGKVSQMDLKELADLYSKRIDKLILQKEKEEDLKYIGGEMKISYLDEDYFNMFVALYFRDWDKQWKEVSTKSQPQSAKYLKLTAREELRERKTVTFTIEPPKESRGFVKNENATKPIGENEKESPDTKI